MSGTTDVYLDWCKGCYGVNSRPWVWPVDRGDHVLSLSSSLSSIYFPLFYMYTYFACMCICTMRTPGQKVLLNALELEVQMAVGCCVGAGK